MRRSCFFGYLGVVVALFSGGIVLAEVSQQHNKQAIERVVKMYVSFEARHEIGPGVDADLKLPKKAKFFLAGAEKSLPWVYPISLGLEIRIGDAQEKVLVLSPQKVGEHYLVATESLKVESFTEKEIQPILVAIEKRLKKLNLAPSEGK